MHTNGSSRPHRRYVNEATNFHVRSYIINVKYVNLYIRKSGNILDGKGKNDSKKGMAKKRKRKEKMVKIGPRRLLPIMFHHITILDHALYRNSYHFRFLLLL